MGNNNTNKGLKMKKLKRKRKNVMRLKSLNQMYVNIKEHETKRLTACK